MLAPEAESEVDVPEQIFAGLTAIVGRGFTLTCVVALPIQPSDEVPLNE